MPQCRPESTQVCQWCYFLQVLFEPCSFLFTQAVQNRPLKDDSLSLYTVTLVPPTSYAGPITAQAAANLFQTCSLLLLVALEGTLVLLMAWAIGLERRSARSARGLVFEDAILGVMVGKRAG